MEDIKGQNEHRMTKNRPGLHDAWLRAVMLTCNLTIFLSILTVLNRKSTPIVLIYDSVKVSSANLSNIQLFPTPETYMHAADNGKVTSTTDTTITTPQQDSPVSPINTSCYSVYEEHQGR
jgi:hypothetical protein